MTDAERAKIDDLLARVERLEKRLAELAKPEPAPKSCLSLYPKQAHEV